MRKCLLFVALLIVSQLNNIKAQSLFGAPDTVCVRQPVYLTDSANASSYYWGFCSGYLFNAPTTTPVAGLTGLDAPGDIELAKEGANYFGFITNSGTDELVRLDFGNSLANFPTITNFGTLNNTMPEGPTNLFLTKDSSTNEWFLFIVGGNTQATSSLTRVDLGSALNNVPNSVNFGNLAGLLNSPRGIMVYKQDTAYVGYVANANDNKLIRLNFGKNISLTPIVTDLGNLLNLNTPSDLIAIKESTNWHIFATNQGNNSLTRLDFGSSLLNFPLALNLGSMNNSLTLPTSINYARDCNGQHFFITNAGNSDISRVDMPSVAGPYTGTTLTGTATLVSPTGISRVVREQDNLYAFVTNSGDNTLTQVLFPQCTSATVTSSTSPTPPVYRYEASGRYNVYLVVNEGQPDMRVECKEIVVLEQPDMVVHPDTLICQGDTIELFVQAFNSISRRWSPYYNIEDTTLNTPLVWPAYTTDYRIIIPYENGCIVDTGILVSVRKNKADAGPDRTINDGATTLLGGPITTEGVQHTYTWIPSQFISNIAIPNPVVNPPHDFTYYLEVRDDFGCYDIDTVVVRVTCNDLNLPNAFSPESDNPGSNRFGLLNRQIIKLNYLRIFDRWGKLVFETTDVTKQWDGRVNGEPSPFGVYVWEADGFCVEGRRFKKSGNVTLLR